MRQDKEHLNRLKKTNEIYYKYKKWKFSSLNLAHGITFFTLALLWEYSLKTQEAIFLFGVMWVLIFLFENYIYIRNKVQYLSFDGMKLINVKSSSKSEVDLRNIDKYQRTEKSITLREKYTKHKINSSEFLDSEDLIDNIESQLKILENPKANLIV